MAVIPLFGSKVVVRKAYNSFLKESFKTLSKNQELKLAKDKVPSLRRAARVMGNSCSYWKPSWVGHWR